MFEFHDQPPLNPRSGTCQDRVKFAVMGI